VGRYAFKLPDVGEGIAQAEIVAWHVKIGDRVTEDQPLVDVMTDKATVEITSPVSGAVLSTSGEVGDQAAIGSVLVVFDAEGVDGAAPASEPSFNLESAPGPTSAVASTAKSVDAPGPTASPAQYDRAPAGVATPSSSGMASAKPLASPAVRRRAFEAGVALQFISGTGPGGRISMDDLNAYLVALAAGQRSAGVPASDRIHEVKVIGLRRRIAEKMALSKQRIPHYSYIEEVDVTDLEALRAKLNELYGSTRPKLTVLPFLVRALARALPDFPQINALYDDEAGIVRQHEAVHLGIATQTPNGLMVPVLRHAEARGVWDAATEIARLAEAARSGSAKRDELTGSTITLTSLGTLGGVSTTPVINHPEVAIIGPNKIVERPVVIDHAVVVRKMMNLSSSFDHRVVDGHDAAAFVQRVKTLLETPALLFVEGA